MKIGYFLSSEETAPRELVRQASLAEQAGFEGLWISDHFHPWNDEQGHSGFVWSVIGAIAQATQMRVTTAVTCPTVRIHPAVLAQAAATSAVLLEERFTLGLGSGEALNEHILGDRWPQADALRTGVRDRQRGDGQRGPALRPRHRAPRERDRAVCRRRLRRALCGTDRRRAGGLLRGLCARRAASLRPRRRGRTGRERP